MDGTVASAPAEGEREKKRDNKEGYPPPLPFPSGSVDHLFTSLLVPPPGRNSGRASMYMYERRTSDPEEGMEEGRASSTPVPVVIATPRFSEAHSVFSA